MVNFKYWTHGESWHHGAPSDTWPKERPAQRWFHPSRRSFPSSRRPVPGLASPPSKNGKGTEFWIKKLEMFSSISMSYI